MVSLRFSSSSLAVFAVSCIALLSTTVVVVIAQEDEMVSSNNNITSSVVEDGVEEVVGDDFVDIDVTNSTETEEEFDVTETDLEVDIIEEDIVVDDEDVAVGSSNITMAPTGAPTNTFTPTTFEPTTFEPTTLSPSTIVVPAQQQDATPTITLGPKSTPVVAGADSAEPGWTDPVMSISGGASSSSPLIAIVTVAAVAVATSMIL